MPLDPPTTLDPGATDAATGIDADAHALLERLTGRPAATFRDGQLEAIRAAVTPGSRTLLVQRTGWGKSAVYFIATRLRRDQGAGPTLLVSPLLALMRNQIDAAARMGVRAATINSTNTDDWDEVVRSVLDDEIDLLVISPERLANSGFRQRVLGEVGARAGLLVVDEAHCISDWGHDFRPDYRRIVRVLDLLASDTPVLCCTATANDRVVADVVAQLRDDEHDLTLVRGPLGRPGLALHARQVGKGTQAERLAWLATVLPQLPGSGIVYCLTVADAERVATFLGRNGIEARAYSGQATNEERIAAEEALLANRIKVLVATSALGMGFDKPDLAFVVHFQSPGSPVAYYQQVGRAGRQLDESLGVLLLGNEDADIQNWFIDTAFPSRPVAEAVVDLLDESGLQPVSVGRIEAEVNVSRGRLSTLLKVLEVEDAIESVKGGYVRTRHPWAYDTERVEGVTANRRAEQAELARYASLGDGTCRMAALRAVLDDADPGAAEPCGICDRCQPDQPVIGLDPPAALVGAAVSFLRDAPLTIEPRKQWPPGLTRVKGRIGDLAAEDGRALCRWTDGGWGDLVRDAIEGGAHLPAEVIDAAEGLARGWWELREVARAERPIVVAVPSRRPGDAPAVLAAALAERLRLELVPALSIAGRRADRPAQADMQNSAQQVENVLSAFVLDESLIPEGKPVLLVDDTVDSRWTLTVAASLLRRAGSGTVHPLVLADRRS